MYEDFDKGDYAKCYDNLIRRIYDEDIKKKTQLGECPFVGSSLSDKITTNMNLQTVNFNNPSLEGKVSFDYKKNNGLFSIGVSDYSFTTMWSECGNGSIYCYNDMIKRIGYNPAYKQFPSKGELSDFDYSARCKSLKIGEVIILENCNYYDSRSIKLSIAWRLGNWKTQRISKGESSDIEEKERL